MSNFKDFYDKLENWEQEFEPIQDKQNNTDKIYETYSPHFEQLIKDATALAGSKDNAHYHIWSRVDGENGKLILLNGIRLVNRLDYMLCKNPWKEDPKDPKYTYIESVYEED